MLAAAEIALLSPRKQAGETLSLPRRCPLPRGAHSLPRALSLDFPILSLTLLLSLGDLGLSHSPLSLFAFSNF